MILGTMVLMAAFAQNPTEAQVGKAPEAGQVLSSQDQLKRTIELRKARRARAAAGKAQAQAARAAQAERMAPILMQQQAQAAQFALEAQRNQATQAMADAQQRMADAEQKRAAVAYDRYRLESQALGVPQVFQPGVGMVPYTYGMATPLRLPR